MGNASLLEASRRSWKEGGAISQGRYKGTQSAKSVGSWSSGGLLVVFGSWSSSRCGLLVVFFSSVFFLVVVVLVYEEAVRGATRSLELAVGGESGRRGGDADWRRRSASCVARTCAFV